MQRIGSLRGIDEGVPNAIALDDGRRLCLVRAGDEVFAFEDRCPHRDFALSSGDIVSPCVIECPWHGARFDVRSGAVLQGPSTDPLSLVEVQVLDGEVFVGPSRSA